MEIRVSEYKTRADLESAISGLQIKTDAVIVGTREELAAKQLSETTNVWGVQCKIIG